MTRNRLHWKILSLVLVCVAGLAFTGCPPRGDGQVFSFVVIADPHVSNNSDNADELGYCVDWINEHFDDPDNEIAMVFVVGDMGGSHGNLAKDILDALLVPYIPLIGDNDVHGSVGGEGENRHYSGGWEFEDTFADVYAELSGAMENWKKSPPVWNPEIEAESYLQNFSFDHQGVHFVCLDWCTRKNPAIPESELQSEQADLHDFDGGTYRWFTEDVASSNKDVGENIVMLTHHAMHVAPIINNLPVNLGAFDREELDQIETFTAGHADNVAANIAGHYHINLSETSRAGGYDIHMTWASHLEPTTRMKLVKVYRDAKGDVFDYSHETVFPERERP